ncbi:MAG: PAS domain-containing protein [Bacteroidetes bacterium]|nr:PAS domain-containing protein [Bacteroidota bacterium]
MKNKTNQIIIIYLLTALFVVIIFYKFSLSYYQTENYPYFNFIKDAILVLTTGLIFRYILTKNDKRSTIYFNQLKQINEDFKESNDKYDIVAKATSDTIWDWKIEEDQMIWSKGIQAVYGYGENEVGNGSNWWFENIHPEDSIKMSIKLYSFLEQKTEKWQDEYRFKCADNTYKYVLDRGFLLKDENGKAVRMIGAIQDITKQKEEELRLKLLETVIVQTKESIIITEADFDNHKLPKIVYANPAYTSMTGFESHEVIGKTPDLFQGQKASFSAMYKILKTLHSRQETLIETLSTRKNKEEFWLRFSMIPIYNSEHELTHWVSMQKDVSEEKKQEKEKEHLINELTQNNKDLKQFSYITSHNLRAPVSNLTGLLNLIDDIPIDDPELAEILGGFQKSTNLLNETINDLTKVMIIKDKSAVQKEDVLLEDVFKNVCNQLSFQIEAEQPILNINLADVPSIRMNKPYIESILLNLLTNAIKYKCADKTLEIAIEANQLKDKTILTFTDNGIGIDLDRNKDKVFGLYQRFHDYPDSKGLGLYLVKSQVEAMAGTISINSEVNKGTTFTLTFKNK